MTSVRWTSYLSYLTFQNLTPDTPSCVLTKHIQWQSETPHFLIDWRVLLLHCCCMWSFSLTICQHEHWRHVSMTAHNMHYIMVFVPNLDHRHLLLFSTQTQILENTLWPLCVPHLQTVKEPCVSWHLHCGLSVLGDSPCALCFSWLVSRSHLASITSVLMK